MGGVNTGGSTSCVACAQHTTHKKKMYPPVFSVPLTTTTEEADCFGLAGLFTATATPVRDARLRVNIMWAFL